MAFLSNNTLLVINSLTSIINICLGTALLVGIYIFSCTIYRHSANFGKITTQIDDLEHSNSVLHQIVKVYLAELRSPHTRPPPPYTPSRQNSTPSSQTHSEREIDTTSTARIRHIIGTTIGARGSPPFSVTTHTPAHNNLTPRGTLNTLV